MATVSLHTPLQLVQATEWSCARSGLGRGKRSRATSRTDASPTAARTAHGSTETIRSAATSLAQFAGVTTRLGTRRGHLMTTREHVAFRRRSAGVLYEVLLPFRSCFSADQPRRDLPRACGAPTSACSHRTSRPHFAAAEAWAHTHDARPWPAWTLALRGEPEAARATAAEPDSGACWRGCSVERLPSSGR